MCLGVPGRVVEVYPGTPWVVVETSGLRRAVGIHIVGKVELGEYLMIHAGYAIEKIDLAEAGKRLSLLEELLGDNTGKPS